MNCRNYSQVNWDWNWGPPRSHCCNSGILHIGPSNLSCLQLPKNWRKNEKKQMFTSCECDNNWQNKSIENVVSSAISHSKNWAYICTCFPSILEADFTSFEKRQMLVSFWLTNEFLLQTEIWQFILFGGPICKISKRIFSISCISTPKS